MFEPHPPRKISACAAFPPHLYVNSGDMTTLYKRLGTALSSDVFTQHRSCEWEICRISSYDVSVRNWSDSNEKTQPPAQ
jgi:hypothetical protein